MHTADTRKPNLSSGKPEKPEKTRNLQTRGTNWLKLKKKISGHFSYS